MRSLILNNPEAVFFFGVLGAGTLALGLLVMPSQHPAPSPAQAVTSTGPTFAGEFDDCKLYSYATNPDQFGNRNVLIARCPGDVEIAVLNP